MPWCGTVLSVRAVKVGAVYQWSPGVLSRGLDSMDAWHQ